MGSSVHVNNKGKDILILGEGPRQGLDDTTLTAEAKYRINFTQSGKRFTLSLYYNGSNSFLFVNTTKIYLFKAEKSEIEDYATGLGNISKNFTIDIIKKTWLKGVVKFLHVNFNPADTNNILNIHKYLIKRTWYKVMFQLSKKIFSGLLTSIVKSSNHTQCISLSNQEMYDSTYSY